MGFVSIQKEGAVATITIDRPQALNALNQEVLLELRETFLKCDGVKVVILTGGGPKAFVAGADIAQMADFNTLQARAFGE